MTLGQKLVTIAQTTREHIATTEFSREKILAACHDAAAAGHMDCEMRPSAPVDIIQTEAYRVTLETFAKQRMVFDWVARRDNRDGKEWPVLHISWAPREWGKVVEIPRKTGPTPGGAAKVS